ncbi:MAG: Spy/CpxP family protein refolding chaperone [Rhodopila sp.]|nr:Spy/CpxP family protein refolding chaperone [Rhodopila sp.]
MSLKLTSYAGALLASLLLAPVALPVGAFAQTPTQAGDTSATPSPKAPAAKRTSVTDRVEQHIARLHAQLHITPAQQAQWDQFAQVMRDNAKDMHHTLEQRGASFASMNAAENMQSYAQIALQHAQDTQKLATAFQALYASMSDDQKKIADGVFRAQGNHPARARRVD